MKHGQMAFAGVVVALTGTIASGQISIEPDDAAPGSVITNFFPNVTLTTFDEPFPGVNPRDVFALEDPAVSTTGTLVFGHDDDNSTWGNGTFEYLQLDFDMDIVELSADFIANDDGGDDNAELLAFDADGNLVDSAFMALVEGPTGNFVTLTVSAPNIRTVAFYWDEINRISSGGLDNILYTVPAPGTLGLLGAAGLCMMRRRR